MLTRSGNTIFKLMKPRVTQSQQAMKTKINHCAVIYEDDSDFGSVDVIDTDQFQQPELLPSQRIDLTTLSHLSVEQRTKLLALLDKYSECLSEKPGFFTVEQHKFGNFADCKPLRLKVNYMLEDLKPLIEARLHELFRLSCVPQRNRVGDPDEMCLGEPVQNVSKIKPVKGPGGCPAKIQKLDFWTTHHYIYHNPLTYITESSTECKINEMVVISAVVQCHIQI